MCGGWNLEACIPCGFCLLVNCGFTLLIDIEYAGMRMDQPMFILQFYQQQIYEFYTCFWRAAGRLSLPRVIRENFAKIMFVFTMDLVSKATETKI